MTTNEEFDKAIKSNDAVALAKIDKDIEMQLDKDIEMQLDKDIEMQLDKDIEMQLDKDIEMQLDKDIEMQLDKDIAESLDKYILDELDKYILDELDKYTKKEMDYAELARIKEEKLKTIKFEKLLIDNNSEGIREFLSTDERDYVTNTNLLFTLLHSDYFDLQIFNLLISFFNNETKIIGSPKKRSRRQEKMTNYIHIHNKTAGYLPEFKGLSSLMVACRNSSIDKIFEVIKLLIENGADILKEDSDKRNVLYYLKNNIDNDLLKFFIDSGLNINHIDSMGLTPLMYCSLKGKSNLVKIFIKNGADINIKSEITAYNIASNDEIKSLIQKSTNNNPQQLLKLLSNFTIDKPIKYTTHSWDFGDLKNEYGDFDGYMSAVKKQFDSMKSELEELSPNLYKKIKTFLINTNPDENYSWCSKTPINIGWSSLDGLKEHCDSEGNPFDFKLSKSIFIGRKQLATFGEVINLFKQEIEIRENFKNLSTLFINQQKRIDESFELDISTAKLGRQFYTDTQKFSSVLDKIFADMGTRKEYPNITVATTELEDRSIELKITQLDSNSSRSADELLERAKEAGDIKEIKESLTNLCDWSVESCYDEQSFRVNFLHSNNVKEIVPLESKVDGFTHILRFYK